MTTGVTKWAVRKVAIAMVSWTLTRNSWARTGPPERRRLEYSSTMRHGRESPVGVNFEDVTVGSRIIFPSASLPSSNLCASPDMVKARVPDPPALCRAPHHRVDQCLLRSGGGDGLRLAGPGPGIVELARR